MNDHSLQQSEEDRNSAGQAGRSRCIRCNKPLSTPASVAAGIGPICASLAAAEAAACETVAPGDTLLFSPPLTAELVFGQDGDGAAFVSNVPMLLTGKSPSGYGCGYGGSGPMALAINAVEQYLRLLGYSGRRLVPFTSRPDEMCYLAANLAMWDFCQAFIAPASRDQLNRVAADDIFSWLRDWLENSDNKNRVAVESQFADLPLMAA